jgi:hypothetical protein
VGLVGAERAFANECFIDLAALAGHRQ